MNSYAATAAVQPAEHEYPAFCAGVQRLCKVDLTSYTRAQMERRIRTFAASRGKPELLDYLALLAHDEGELEFFIARMTINVSQLWRNPLQWQTLAELVLPELGRSGRIRAWSAGCSNGAEVYTLAALCREAVPAAAVEVRGTDIDERMIAKARIGSFSEADMRNVPALSRRRWFDGHGSGWQVKRELLELAHFEAENLLTCSPPPGAYDLICCRNTVIYFTEPSRGGVHERLAEALRPGGWLMVGCTERITLAETHGLELVLPFTYRKS